MADAIDTDDCSLALQGDFAGKTAVHPSSGWLPRHYTAVPAESGRPTRQETSSVWPWSTLLVCQNLGCSPVLRDSCRVRRVFGTADPKVML